VWDVYFGNSVNFEYGNCINILVLLTIILYDLLQGIESDTSGYGRELAGWKWVGCDRYLWLHSYKLENCI
jgi:hypothetical protein